MSRIPAGILEHEVTIRDRIAVPQPDGALHGAPRTRPALVVMREQVVVDARIASATQGAEVRSSAHVLLQPEDYAPPGSLMTIWAGTPMERTAEVITTAYLEHSIAPSGAQAWLV